jgi:hypothetical protein
MYAAAADDVCDMQSSQQHSPFSNQLPCGFSAAAHPHDAHPPFDKEGLKLAEQPEKNTAARAAQLLQRTFWQLKEKSVDSPIFARKIYRATRDILLLVK